MHYQKVLALSSLLLSGVMCAPLPQSGNHNLLRMNHLLKLALGKSALAADQAYTQKRGGPLSNAADDAYTFTVSFDDKGKLIMDPGVDTSILKNPGIFKTPISTTPVGAQHLKRGDPKISSTDDAYAFTISFDNKGKLVLDPAIDSNIF